MENSIILEEVKKVSPENITVSINKEKTKFGDVEIAVIKCVELFFNNVISIAVKYGCPHERFNGGVKIYFW